MERSILPITNGEEGYIPSSKSSLARFTDFLLFSKGDQTVSSLHTQIIINKP